ncbi:hypothetical protein [Nitrosomonas cryotolerans]
MSYRESEEMMLERGFGVAHTMLYYWAQHLYARNGETPAVGL